MERAKCTRSCGRTDSFPTSHILCVSFSTKLSTPVDNFVLWKTYIAENRTSSAFFAGNGCGFSVFPQQLCNTCRKTAVYRKKTNSDVRMQTIAPAGSVRSAGQTYSAPCAASAPAGSVRCAVSASSAARSRRRSRARAVIAAPDTGALAPPGNTAQTASSEVGNPSSSVRLQSMAAHAVSVYRS